MQMKLTFICLVLSGFLVSCEKEYNLIIENTDIPLISKVLYDKTLSTEYLYNEANLIREEKSRFSFSRHSYNSRNLLISTELYLDERIFSSSISVLDAAYNRTDWVNPENTERIALRSFEYDDKDHLVKLTITRKSDSSSEYSEFSYDDNDRISRQTYYWQSVISGYADYFYNEKGNLVKCNRFLVVQSGDTIPNTTTEYEYDNKPNPYKSFKRLMIPGINTNENNITKETYTLLFDVDALTENVHIIENSYEYNENGYPIKKNGSIVYQYK